MQAVPTGLPYGERQQLQAQEQTAPMSATPDTPNLDLNGGGTPNIPPAPAGFTGLPGFGQGNPGEPITSGLPIGPGPGPEVLPLQHQPQFTQQGPMTQLLQQLSARDTSGVLSALLTQAQGMGA